MEGGDGLDLKQMFTSSDTLTHQMSSDSGDFPVALSPVTHHTTLPFTISKHMSLSFLNQFTNFISSSY